MRDWCQNDKNLRNFIYIIQVNQHRQTWSAFSLTEIITLRENLTFCFEKVILRKEKIPGAQELLFLLDYATIDQTKNTNIQRPQLSWRSSLPRLNT